MHKLKSFPHYLHKQLDYNTLSIRIIFKNYLKKENITK